jgi:hypothetical protein
MVARNAVDPTAVLQHRQNSSTVRHVASKALSCHTCVRVGAQKYNPCRFGRFCHWPPTRIGSPSARGVSSSLRPAGTVSSRLPERHCNMSAPVDVYDSSRSVPAPGIAAVMRGMIPVTTDRIDWSRSDHHLTLPESDRDCSASVRRLRPLVPDTFTWVSRSKLFAVAGTAAALLWGEWQNHRWSRMLVNQPRGGTLAVVVPGFRNRHSTANLINRSRARIAVRSARLAEDVTVVFCGGAPAGGPAEAQLLAAHAKDRLGFEGRTLLETESLTTWENVTNAMPLIEGADQIVVASQPAHALKVRAYIQRQRPDLAERIVRGADYRPGEWSLVKPFLALYGLWTLRELTPEERRIAR